MLLERLLDNLSLDVGAFATCRVAHGWRLRLPALDWVTFHFVLRGRGEVRGGVPEGLGLSAGSLAVVPPHLVHGIQCGPGPYAEQDVGQGGVSRLGLPEHLAGPDADAEMLVICGKVQVVYGGAVGLFDQLREVLVIDFADEPKMREIFEALLAEVRSPAPGSRALATALMTESLIHVFRRLCAQPECELPWLAALEDPALRPALEAMIEKPERTYTVEKLAKLCYMSRSVFARRFRDSFGLPPLEYLRGIRLRNAARLLRRDPPLPVGTVAARVGFESRSQFSRAFKAYFDHSPTEFRA